MNQATVIENGRQKRFFFCFEILLKKIQVNLKLFNNFEAKKTFFYCFKAQQYPF